MLKGTKKVQKVADRKVRVRGLDRRVRRTQQELTKALIALTLEKGYDTVTIRDITERAEVGYATFFRHYHTKNELLSDVLEFALAELRALLSPPPVSNDPEIAGRVFFHYVQEHAEVVRVLLDSHILRQKLFELATQSTLGDTQKTFESEVPLEVAAQHIVASSMALIEWWLKRGMPYPPEKMGQIYAELIAGPTNAFVVSQMSSFSPPS